MEHRFWQWSIALLLCVSVAGCGSKSKTEDGEAEQSAEELAPDANGADPLSNTDPLPSTDAAPAPSTPPSAPSKWSGSTPMPKVAANPFESSGVWMNAYQFVRSNDDSWETLATRAYGSSQQWETLKNWNPGVRLKPGNIVYYNSPQRPTDQERIRHIADDLGLPLDNVTVNAGDTLSKMAENFYQEPRLWREIAALNPSISRPDWVIPGTALRVMPPNAGAASGLGQSAPPVTGGMGSLSKVDSLDSTPTPSEKPMNRPTASVTPPAPKPVTIAPPIEAAGSETMLEKLMRLARENLMIVAGAGLGLVGLAGTIALRARARANA